MMICTDTWPTKQSFYISFGFGAVLVLGLLSAAQGCDDKDCIRATNYLDFPWKNSEDEDTFNKVSSAAENYFHDRVLHCEESIFFARPDILFEKKLLPEQKMPFWYVQDWVSFSTEAGNAWSFQMVMSFVDASSSPGKWTSSPTRAMTPAQRANLPADLVGAGQIFFEDMMTRQHSTPKRGATSVTWGAWRDGSFGDFQFHVRGSTLEPYAYGVTPVSRFLPVSEWRNAGWSLQYEPPWLPQNFGELSMDEQCQRLMSDELGGAAILSSADPNVAYAEKTKLPPEINRLIDSIEKASAHEAWLQAVECDAEVWVAGSKSDGLIAYRSPVLHTMRPFGLYVESLEHPMIGRSAFSRNTGTKLYAWELNAGNRSTSREHRFVVRALFNERKKFVRPKTRDSAARLGEWEALDRLSGFTVEGTYAIEVDDIAISFRRGDFENMRSLQTQWESNLRIQIEPVEFGIGAKDSLCAYFSKLDEIE